VLINLLNNKRHTVVTVKAAYNIGDINTMEIDLPFGTYTCSVYTNFSKKLLKSFSINFNTQYQKIELTKNGYN
jgi:hypothetical protein